MNRDKGGIDTKRQGEISNSRRMYQGHLALRKAADRLSKHRPHKKILVVKAKNLLYKDFLCFTTDKADRIRLVRGSSSNEGRVEVRQTGSSVWGTICDDSFGFNDANVVCRMLGYLGAAAVRGSAHFGQGYGSIFMDEVRCTGTESSLFACSYSGWGRHDCTHREDVGVVCYPYRDIGCRTVRISGTYSHQYDRMTTYTMTGAVLSGSPVYRSSRGDYLFYYLLDGSWHVGPQLGTDYVGMYISDTSIFADSTAGTWYLFNGYSDFQPYSSVRVSCTNPSAVVNGQWSTTWSSWSSCQWRCICGNDTCVPDIVTRYRWCITPPPRNGGSYCSGSSTSTKDCDCHDINECLDNTLNNCDLNNGGICVNTRGSYYCRCEDGYNLQPDGRTCQDIDECANNDVCENGTCTNIPGSYNCTCDPGYMKDSTSDTQNCADINECEDDDFCGNGRCTNNPGSYDCHCNFGHKKNPTTRKCEGLTTGVIIGIVLGAVAAVVLVTVICYCCCCKKSGSIATSGGNTQSTVNTVSGAVPPPATPPPMYYPPTQSNPDGSLFVRVVRVK